MALTSGLCSAEAPTKPKPKQARLCPPHLGKKREAATASTSGPASPFPLPLADTPLAPLASTAPSGAVKDRLYELYDKFTTAVDELARSCGKSSLTLHQMVGTVIKTPRGLNAWNVWQRYFAETTLKEQKLQGGDYTKQARTAFIAACRVGDDFLEEKLKDSDAVFERLPWLLEWNKKLTQQAVIAVREKGKLKPKLRREIKPVTQIAKQMLDTYGVHEMRALQLHNLNQQVKDQEHTFGMIEMRKRGLAAHSIPIQNLNPHEHEGPRDVFRRQFTSIIGGQLWAFCHAAGTLSGQDVDRARFQMKWNTKFIDVARESKCRIVNYPAALQAANQIIGTQQFNVKKIKSATFERFMSSLVKANETRNANDDADDIMQIVAWEQDEIDLPLDEQGDVAVVVDEHGVGLVTVKQSDGYAKEVKKQAEKAEKAEKRKRKKERGTGAQQQDEEGGTRTARINAPNPAPLPALSRHVTTARVPTHAPVLLPAPSRGTTTARVPTHAPALLPAPSRRATIARMPTHAPALLSVPSRHATTARAPTHASDPLPALGRRTTTARAPAHARVPLPAPGRPASTGPRTATITPGMRTRRPVPDHHRALHNGPSPLASKEGTGPSRTSGMTKLLAHAQTAALSLRGRRRRSPPRLDLSRMDAVAARVGAARRDHRAQGPDEKRGPKRKAPHDEELLDRDHKRYRGTEETEEALPLLKCRIIVNEKRGGIFFATHLQNVDRPIRADGVFYVHNPERRVWKQIGPNVAPVLATEDDRKQYAKELEDFGL
ncbi:hypothetical protein B0H14DRAFT_3857071 [Mycena olivaceomarginata]|nr:hypothetical protein B0H14DRAFT_3857071 [Mycena olivaceomarginata]